jgi:hypothetical protein
VPALLHSPPFGADVMRFLIYAVGNPNAKIVVNISFAFCECPTGQLPLPGQCRNSGSNSVLVRVHTQLLESSS